jgi:hypothetical protein
MAKKPKLSLVRPSLYPVPTPPRPLGQHGRQLWNSVHAEYEVVDAGGIEMLCLACASLDRAEQLKTAIDEDGPIIRSKAGVRDNPLLKHELAARAFTVRTLQKLGLNFEPVRAPGRPPGAF